MRTWEEITNETEKLKLLIKADFEMSAYQEHAHYGFEAIKNQAKLEALKWVLKENEKEGAR